MGYDSSDCRPDGEVTRIVSVPVVAPAAFVIVNGYAVGSVVQGTVKELG